MRVLTAVQDLGPGGTQRAAENYARGYHEAGVASAVLGYDGGGPRAETLSEAQLPVFTGGTDPAVFDQALAQAADWHPDVLHIHRTGRPDARSAEVMRRLKDAVGEGLVVFETNVFARVDYSPANDLIDVHLHLSQWCLWKWQQWKRRVAPDSLGVIVPYSADHERFYRVSRSARAAFRAAHKLPDEAIVFGRIGQPDWLKWHPSVFEAFEEAHRRLPQAHLVLVGLPAELRPHLDRLSASARANVREISFLHGDDALRAAYSALDVFIHAAEIGESFGMVLAEAMLCECPVITLSTPLRDNSQLEVVGHEVGGLVVANVDGMIEAMVRLAEDADERTRLGTNGRQRTIDRFGFAPVMDRLLHLLSLVSDRPARQTLRHRLETDDLLTTHASTQHVRKLLAVPLGRHTRRELLMMQLAHQPDLFRAWHQIKHVWLRALYE